MRRQYAVLAASAVSLFTLAGPAQAAKPPVGKIFDCYSNGGPTGLTYVQAIELKTRSQYLVAPFRKGSRLSGKAAPGRYRTYGSKISWITGPYKDYRGVFHAQTATSRSYIELDTKQGAWTGVSCYPY